MSGQVITETVSAKEADVRLDRWVKRRMPMTQGELEKLLRTGQIRVDGARAKANTRLAAGMEVRLPPFKSKTSKSGEPWAAPNKPDSKALAFLRPLIIHEDEDMFVLNKPAGIAVQGGTKQGRHIDGMLDALSDGEHRPRLVHRLDKDTSGLLVIARHPAAAARLGELFRSRDMDKIYWAVTVGVPKPMAGQLRSWMRKGEGPEGRERMVLGAHGDRVSKHAITDYATVSTAGQKAAWVALKPQTGRMHQLRFHMHELGTSILGDTKYETAREAPQGVGKGLHLHARALVIPRPHGKPLVVQAPLSGTMKETFSALGFRESEAGKDPLELFA
ncbi:MAG: RluA family pseudouridine synthase [Alphaproteobacteria bacterium]|nr:RluA family pseudouridine synthase [Alphaproteobacteria bacterium]